MTPCPACRATGPFEARESYHDPVGGKDYRLLSCGACGLIFATPFVHPGGEWYARFSASDSYEGAGEERFGWFLERGFRPGGRLLDVGCGAGHFLERARAAGYAVAGVDPNAEAVAGAKSRGLDVFHGGLEEYAKTAPPGSFDAVTMFDVLEHFDNPREMVAAAASLLKPGGALVITTPNGLRPVPFGREAFDCPPHHLTRWNPDVLEKFLAAAGLTVAWSQHSHLPVWEFSRHLVGRLTGLALRLTKRLLYGRKAAGATLTQLAASSGTPRLIADKGARMRLVHRFETGLGWLAAPFFLPMKWYYRLTRPGCGVTSRVLAVKPEARR